MLKLEWHSLFINIAGDRYGMQALRKETWAEKKEGAEIGLATTKNEKSISIVVKLDMSKRTAQTKEKSQGNKNEVCENSETICHQCNRKHHNNANCWEMSENAAKHTQGYEPNFDGRHNKKYQLSHKMRRIKYNNQPSWKFGSQHRGAWLPGGMSKWVAMQFNWFHQNCTNWFKDFQGCQQPTVEE